MSGGLSQKASEIASANARTFDPFDLDAVRGALIAYLRRVDDPSIEVGPLRRFTVGFSWVTYGFSVRQPSSRPERKLILRIGPPTGIFGPYRASPESIAMQHLAAGSGVPVPRVHWYSDDLDTFGAPFFISDFVAGEVPIPWTAGGGEAFDDEMRSTVGSQFLGAMASLHNFEWRGKLDSVIDGVTDVDKTANAQIDYWVGKMHEWSDRRFPMLEWAVIWFRAHAPRASRISVVHGDYRIGNFLLDRNKITAILDWELVHLGDPLEDLGWLCLQAWRGRSPNMCHLFPREELYARYEALTGLPLDRSAVNYWEAFGTFKLAVMHLGATYCYEARGFNDLRMAAMGAQIPRMLLQLETALERAS